jgi:hypothetical protein
VTIPLIRELLWPFDENEENHENFIHVKQFWPAYKLGTSPHYKTEVVNIKSHSVQKFDFIS